MGGGNVLQWDSGCTGFVWSPPRWRSHRVYHLSLKQQRHPPLQQDVVKMYCHKTHKASSAVWIVFCTSHIIALSPCLSLAAT